MDIYTLLMEDHSKVSDFFKELESTGERAFEQRERIFQRLKAELITHSDAEESIFYARLIQNESLRNTISDSYVDHHKMSELLDELTSLAVNNDGWMPKCRILRALVARHVAQEEGALFAKAKMFLSPSEAEEIGNQFLGLKDNSIGISA